MPRAKGGSIPPPRVFVEPNHGGIISELNENDVLCGRGGRINNHPGNITFRVIVEEYKREYLDPRTRKLEKAHVAARLVAQIRSANPPGRFLKDDPNNAGMYFEIGDVKAWKKAGQALREDAPDVRKEIGEELEATAKEQSEHPKEHDIIPFPSPQHQPSSYDHLQQQKQHQQHEQQHHHHHQQQQQPVLPHGIPPSVSYSPTSGPGLATPSSGSTLPSMSGPRPDPPEAPGVTGYRQPPLRYFESGRGSGGGGGGPFSGRGGRGHPPHHQQYSTHHPPQQMLFPHPTNYQGPTTQPIHHQQQQQQPPPPSFNQPQYSQYGQLQYQHQSPPPHYQHQPTPPNQFQNHSFLHTQPQPQAYPSHPQPRAYPSHPQPQKQQHLVEEKSGHKDGPYPQFSAPPGKQTRKKTTKSASPVRLPLAGITSDMLYATNHNGSSIIHGQQSQDFPLAIMSAMGKDFSDSDISAIGRGPSETSDKSGKSSRDDSFTMSDLFGGSNQSIGISLGSSLGRTRSFPDLTLSANDLLPPLPAAESEHEYDHLNTTTWANEEKEKLRTSSRGRTMRPFHRHSSSESSNQSMTSLTIRGFHPVVRSRTNTAVSGINDAMSIMSLDSRKSIKSDASSWLDNFRSFQSIQSDMNPWEAPTGESLIRPTGDEGSLSDVSYDMTALDLAEPLLPPLTMNDSYEFMKPDP